MMAKFLVFRTAHLDEHTPPVAGAVREGAAWFVDVPDIAALLAIAAAEGDGLIVDAKGHKRAPGFPSIEVYDDYRE